jgi:hypothetical protein
MSSMAAIETVPAGTPFYALCALFRTQILNAQINIERCQTFAPSGVGNSAGHSGSQKPTFERTATWRGPNFARASLAGIIWGRIDGAFVKAFFHGLWFHRLSPRMSASVCRGQRAARPQARVKLDRSA